MKRTYISFIFILFLCLSIQAQTGNELTQAKADLKNKEYSNALPVFEREFNAKPTDASLALSYGICLIETGGDPKKAEEVLIEASKKKLPDSYLYLGDIYVKEYRVSEAQEYYDLYAKARPKEKGTALADRYERLEKLERLISRTQDVQIIDSVVIDKSNFMSVYKLSADAGTLSAFKDIFPSLNSKESIVYTNGKGSKIYFGQSIENRSVISTMDKLLSGFGNEKLMSDDNFGLSGDINYPFILTDGTTAYFAGKDDGGMGGYDIYVTRYNLNTDSYLTPELLNMPFNSTANDYMLVYDEIKEIGWFASDRFQPEGKVCIYTFIQNNEFTPIETEDNKYRERRARLSSIKDTWKPGKSYSQLVALAKKETVKATERTVDFIFVVNDNHTYHSLGEFKSASARRMYSDLEERSKRLSVIDHDLDAKRNEYAKTPSAQRNSLTSQILSLENQQALLFKEVAELEVKVRNEEIKVLK